MSKWRDRSFVLGSAGVYAWIAALVAVVAGAIPLAQLLGWLGVACFAVMVISDVNDGL
jgi:hypothetical protein